MQMKSGTVVQLLGEVGQGLFVLAFLWLAWLLVR